MFPFVAAVAIARPATNLTCYSLAPSVPIRTIWRLAAVVLVEPVVASLSVERQAISPRVRQLRHVRRESEFISPNRTAIEKRSASDGEPFAKTQGLTSNGQVPSLRMPACFPMHWERRTRIASGSSTRSGCLNSIKAAKQIPCLPFNVHG